jgi:tetratricopeptide (TPR) repeat protein
MEMDLNNPVIRLCVQGTQAEYRRDQQAACECYRQAWQAAATDLEACIAAHYLARCQDDPQEILRWNQEALDRANRAQDERVKSYYPSLYLNLGRAFEIVGQREEAQRCYRLAGEWGKAHL